MKAYFAVPGDLATPSGGYGYARRLLRDASAAGLALEHVSLPVGFPDPGADDQEQTLRVLTDLPSTDPILVDGLALSAQGALDWLTRERRPIIMLCHHPVALETGLDPKRAADLEHVERRALDLAVAVITTSQATADILRTRYGVPDPKITVARPGTDPAPRAPGSGGPGCSLLAVGSVTPRKGHRRLIAALAGLADADWTLRIVGPMPDAAERAALEAEIARHGLADRVTLTGPLSMTAVQAAYQTADLFVLASEYEGFGMAFTEAMANGLPVLGLECPAVAEATRGAARLAAPADFNAALDDLVRRPASRVALGEACWKAAQHLPRWPDTVQAIADVLRARMGFSADWLSLRVEADARARSTELTRHLAQTLRGRHDPVRVLDLGAGAGANLGALAPNLPGRQSWTLADNDRDLLDRISAPERTEIETRLVDIAADLDQLFDPAPDLVTASAFFDLVGRALADQVVARTVAARAVFHTVLTFDGREEWPDHDLNSQVLEAFLADQRRDKGMGPALGPDAADYLARAFMSSGYRVTLRPSDWDLTQPRDADLIAALAQGHAATARVALGDLADTWLADARKAGRVIIGHQDLMAIPPG